MEVLVLVGCAGSGKSTYSHKLRDSGKKISVVSADLFFSKTGEYKFDATKLGEAHLECFKDYMFVLETWDAEWSVLGSPSGADYLIVDNTNLNMQDITPYTMLAKAYGVPFKIIKFEIDPEVCASRNVHGVPRAKVLDMAERARKLNFPKDWTVERIAA